MILVASSLRLWYERCSSSDFLECSIFSNSAVFANSSSIEALKDEVFSLIASQFVSSFFSISRIILFCLFIIFCVAKPKISWFSPEDFSTTFSSNLILSMFFSCSIFIINFLCSSILAFLLTSNLAKSLLMPSSYSTGTSSLSSFSFSTYFFPDISVTVLGACLRTPLTTWRLYLATQSITLHPLSSHSSTSAPLSTKYWTL